jgi:hypothetical protein
MRKKPDDTEILISSPLLFVRRGVHARYLRNKNERIEIAIIINDETSAEDLRDAWAAIDRIRTKVRKLQGSDMDRIHNALMFSYSQMKKNGWSYSTIAMDINYDCMVNLCQAILESEQSNIPVTMTNGFMSAVTLLRVMRMKEKDIEKWLGEAVEEIKAGGAPWALDSGPVDPQRVRDATRQWERRQDSQQVIIKEPPKYQIMPVTDLVEKNKEQNQMAQDLLNHSFPGSLSKYDEIVRKILETSGWSGGVHSSG